MSNQFPPPSKAMMLLRCNDYWEVNKMKKKKNTVKIKDNMKTGFTNREDGHLFSF